MTTKSDATKDTTPTPTAAQTEPSKDAPPTPPKEDAPPKEPAKALVKAPKRVDPEGLHVFRSLLAHDRPPQDRLAPRQAAILALYASGHEELMAEAMSAEEIREWAARFRTSNPHAWHASLNGDIIRFLLVVSQPVGEWAGKYQSGSTALIATAHAA